MRKRVLWLRADKDSNEIYTAVTPLLRVQGVTLIIPPPGLLPKADIAVLPSKGTPEELYYRPLLESAGIPSVMDRDPLRALALALSHPWPPREVAFGVDPGRSCAVVMIVDGRVLSAFKSDCDMLARSISDLLARIPYQYFNIYLGDGEGVPGAVNSLTDAGLPFTLVREAGSTSNPARTPLARVLHDKDLIAGLTIALRGVYGWGIGQSRPSSKRQASKISAANPSLESTPQQDS
ncbi:MAG: hypothetical protein F7C35_09175 [Desulfurococcales archaeon]|nr:hypothetical protein [Desulfurococcales archaeon]